MDPASAVGLAASVLQIATYAFTSIQALERLRARYTSAPATIEALYAESKLINALLSQLRATFNDKDNVMAVSLRNNRELSSAMDDVLSGCNAVYVRLDAELQTIVSSPLDNNQKFSLRRRASLLFKEDILKSYLSQIHGHQTALTLLIQGLQMHSLSDIHKVVRQTHTILETSQKEAQKITILTQQVEQAAHYEKVPRYDQAMPEVVSGPALSPLYQITASPTLLPSPQSAQSPSSLRLPSPTLLSSPMPPLPPYRQGTLPRESAAVAELPDNPARVDSLIDFTDPPVIVRTPEDEPLTRTLQELNNLKFNDDQWQNGTVGSIEQGTNRNSDQSFITLSTVSSPTESEIRYSRSRGNSRDSALTSPHLLDQPDIEDLNIKKLSRSNSILTIATMEELSAFPKITNPPATLPHVVEDEANSLFSNREQILLTTDADQQMTWAEDVLRFTFRSNRHRQRTNRGLPENQKSPPEEQMLRSAAREIVEARCGQGLARAMFLKAKWCESNAARARETHLGALAKGYLRSAYYVGRDYENRKQHDTALGYYRQGVDGQDSACLYRMGVCSLRGEMGQKKDHSKAIPLLRSATRRADKDFPESLFLMGTLNTKAYRENFKISKKELPIDDNAAREHYLQAARLGHSGAQLKIGLAYQSGTLGCTSNPALAMHYLRLAGYNGEAEAELQISTVFGWGQPPTIEANPKFAYLYARRAADSGLVAAYSQVGYFFEQGIGVSQNYVKAKDWYLKGAAVGDKICGKRLDALMGRTGRNVLGSST